MGALRKTPLLAVALALAAAAALLFAACGADEDETDVVEGEPVHLGDVSYNVQITRFLNPDDPEDSEYVEGQPEPAAGEQYLGVFMIIDNEGDQAAQIPSSFEIEDTTDATYEAVESDSPFALALGSEIAAGEQLPEADTSAANGPIKGSMVLFLVPGVVSENRPLELKIPSSEGDGTVELDI